jgi:mRNA interferase MazF
LSIRRGDLYRITAPTIDPRRHKLYVVVSREAFLSFSYSMAICAPVYSNYLGLATEVLIDESVGIKHRSSVRCDELTSLPRSRLTDFVGSLRAEHIAALDHALAVALGIDHLAPFP